MNIFPTTATLTICRRLKTTQAFKVCRPVCYSLLKHNELRVLTVLAEILSIKISRKFITYVMNPSCSSDHLLVSQDCHEKFNRIVKGHMIFPLRNGFLLIKLGKCFGIKDDELDDFSVLQQNNSFILASSVPWVEVREAKDKHAEASWGKLEIAIAVGSLRI